MGIVSVFPGMFPAIIRVAPNSPSARAKERIVPARIPGQARGSGISRNTRHSDAPSVRAACVKFGSTCSSAARAVRYISGNATTAAASTVAGQEKTIVPPKANRSLPSGPLRPKSRSRKKPTTVGGNIRGIRKSPSTSAAPPPVRLSRHAAAASPMTKVKTVAVALVAIEIHRGDQSIAGELYLDQFFPVDFSNLLFWSQETVL